MWHRKLLIMNVVAVNKGLDSRRSEQPWRMLLLMLATTLLILMSALILSKTFNYTKSIMFWIFLLFSLEISTCYILKTIPTIIDHLRKIQANLLINTKRMIIMQLQITTLNRHEMLSTAKNFLKCNHRNEKYLIVGLSF